MRIVLNHVKKVYGERTVLDLDELCIEPGAFLGIIGQNGAGKSTLLNIIAGIETPASGDVRYGTAKAESPDFRQMTLVTQHPYLLRTTVEKNITYPMRLRGWDENKMRERLETLLEEFGLCQIRKQKAWKLSAGEGQKVALARAISFEPEVLLLDEPTANIDPGTIADIETILRKNNEEKKITVIIITHNLAQARRLCKEVAFLHEGKLLEQGDSQDVLRLPKHPMAAKFIAGELI